MAIKPTLEYDASNNHYTVRMGAQILGVFNSSLDAHNFMQGPGMTRKLLEQLRSPISPQDDFRVERAFDHIMDSEFWVLQERITNPDGKDAWVMVYHHEDGEAIQAEWMRRMELRDTLGSNIKPAQPPARVIPEDYGQW